MDIGAYETQQITLTLITPTLTVTDPGGTYNGTPFAATATINPTGLPVTFDYQQYVNGVWTDLGDYAPSNAGSYDVTANFAGSALYTPVSSSTVNFNITKDRAAVRTSFGSNFVSDAPDTFSTTYTGSPLTGITASVNGVAVIEGVPVVLDYHSSDGTDLGTAIPTNSGMYTLTASFAGSADFSPGEFVANGGSDTCDTIFINPATATTSVTAIPGLVYNWNAQETASYSATGINGNILPSSDFTDTTVHTNAGTYNDIWTFTDPNYATQTGTVTDNIAKADSGIYVTGGTAIYNGSPQALASSILAPVGCQNVVVHDTHTNVGTYIDTWTYTDTSGDFDDASGTMIDKITPAAAKINVMPYNVTYNGQSHAATGTVTGVNGVNLRTDLTISSAHTNAGTYSDTWAFTDPNYVPQTGKITDTINKANATIKVTPYNVTYNGAAHAATGTAIGINGINLGNELAINSTHVNAGTYHDSWIFNAGANYNVASGVMTDIIQKANARIVVLPYNVVFNGNAHAATGYAVGVNGALLAGLNLAGTVHLGGYYTVSFNDRWTFTDTTGNYNSTSGTVVDTIRANHPLYRALYHPFYPRSPFYGRFFMW